MFRNGRGCHTLKFAYINTACTRRVTQFFSFLLVDFCSSVTTGLWLNNSDIRHSQTANHYIDKKHYLVYTLIVLACKKSINQKGQIASFENSKRSSSGETGGLIFVSERTKKGDAPMKQKMRTIHTFEETTNLDFMYGSEATQYALALNFYQSEDWAQIAAQEWMFEPVEISTTQDVFFYDSTQKTEEVYA